MAEKSVIYEIRENVVEIKTNLDNIVKNTDLKFQLMEEKVKVANNRIHDLEEANKWLWRASAGAVIGYVVAFFIKKVPQAYTPFHERLDVNKRICYTTEKRKTQYRCVSQLAVPEFWPKFYKHTF